MSPDILVQNFSFYWGQVQAASALFSLVFIARYARAHAFKKMPLFATPRRCNLVVGGLYALIVSIGMLNPLEVMPGVTIDARVPLVAIAGLVGGWVAAIAAASVSVIMRIYLGGMGVSAGIACILSGAMLGSLLHRSFQDRPELWSFGRFSVFGCLLSFAGLFCVFFLPHELGFIMFRAYFWVVFLIYNVTTLTVGIFEASQLIRERENQKLLQNNELLKVCEELGHIGSWGYDAEKRRFTCSDNLAGMFGVDAARIKSGIEYELRKLVHPDDLPIVHAHWNNTLSGSVKEGPFEFRIVRPDGGIRQIWGANVWTGRSRHGNFMFGILQDVTDFKETQAQLLRSAKLASIGQLAAGVAHEINNPLFILQEQTRRIQKSLMVQNSHDPEMKRSLTHQMESIKRIERIVKGLSSYARGTDHSNVVFDGEQVLNTTLDLFMDLVPKANFALVRGLASEKAPVFGDPSRLEQVLINLLVNALQATEGQTQRTIQVRSAVQASELQIDVQDNGAGIPHENMERIFDSFFTTKEPGKGTGLGLSISLNYVRAMNGRIDVESKPGQGALFRLALPLYQPSA